MVSSSTGDNSGELGMIMKSVISTSSGVSFRTEVQDDCADCVPKDACEVHPPKLDELCDSIGLYKLRQLQGGARLKEL